MIMITTTLKVIGTNTNISMQSKRMINDVNSDKNSSDDDDDDDVPIRRLKHRRFSNDDKSSTKPKQKRIGKLMKCLYQCFLNFTFNVSKSRS